MTEEPTNQDLRDELWKIQNKLEEAEGKSRVVMWVAFMAIGATIVVASLAPQDWWAALGVFMLLIGGLGIWQRWSPW